MRGHGNKISVRFKSTGERAMATWKRLTRENKPVDVNLDAVIYMQEHEGFTALHFAAYGGDRTQSISVSETPDEIHNYLHCTRTTRSVRRNRVSRFEASLSLLWLIHHASSTKLTGLKEKVFPPQKRKPSEYARGVYGS